MKPLQRAADHFQRGQYDQVELVCAEILATRPDDTRAWQMRGLAALHLRKFEDAATFLKEAASRQARPETLINLAVALLALERLPDAINILQHTLELAPENAGAHLTLAACYMQEQRYQDAEDVLEKVLTFKPGWPKALDMQARVVLKRNDNERAWNLALAALAGDPSLSASHRVLGDIAMNRMNFDLAADHYRLSLRNNPNDPETQGNYALLLTRRGDYAEALTWYKRAAEGSPQDAALRHGLGDVLLIQGHLAEGWTQHGWRHLRKEESKALVDQPLLLELPNGVSGIAVLDQGVGDQIMIASIIPDLARQFTNLEVQCDPRLHSLLRRSFPDVRFSSFILNSVPGAAATAGSFGVGDSGRWLRSRFEDFPHHAGYLKPDAGRQTMLRQRYTEKSRGPVVGISWATRKVKLAPHKSLPLATWGPLLSMPGVTFVNLQYDSDPAEVAEAAHRFGARIVSDPTVDASGDLDAFAAQVASMDLVITTSNAAAHFAGALNVPTWVFVPEGMGGIWHWFLEREDSPWYPSVRLFRQTKRGDWQDVVDRASSAFLTFVEQWTDLNP